MGGCVGFVVPNGASAVELRVVVERALGEEAVFVRVVHAVETPSLVSSVSCSFRRASWAAWEPFVAAWGDAGDSEDSEATAPIGPGV